MNICITGASGFLGQQLAAHLEQQGHQVVRLNSRNCDLRRPDSLLAFNGCRYDQIYHLAAWTQAGDFCLWHPGEQWIVNQLINTHVIAWWQQHQPQAKLIAIGSSCCYPETGDLTEDRFLDGLPTDSLFSYAMTKRMLYVGLISINRQYGLRYLCLVPSTLYGPNYHLDGRQMHFIFDLIRKILRARYANEPAVLWGDGYQVRELLHVRDFVATATQLADSMENDLINVGSGEGHTIRDFANILCDIIGHDPARIEYDATRYLGARSKVLNVSKLKRLLPGFKSTPLATGLAETVAWMKKAYHDTSQS